MKCKSHLDNNICQLNFPNGECVGEDNCMHFQLDAKRICPSCNNKGASGSGWGKHGGFNYTCWSCGHVWTEVIERTKTPGICLRCGRPFDNPVPDVTYPEGNPEIACSEWCSDCNTLAMSVVFRESSSYRRKPLRDPVKGGKLYAG